MRALGVQGSFGLEHVTLLDRATSAPGPGQVAIRVAAVALNHRDYLVAKGAYDPRWSLPLVLGSDAVGIVEQVGEGVAEVAVGDRVCPIFAPTWLDGTPTKQQLRDCLGGPRQGVFQERITIEATALVAAPPHLSDVEAATLPCAAVTAYSALFTLGQLTAEQWVLCLGTGGVSLFALQFAKAAGARVVVTSKSESKRARALALGADHVVDYKTNATWGKRVRELTGGGAHHVVDVAGASLDQSLAAVRPGGTVSLIGVLGGNQASLSLLPILMNQVRVQGVLVGSRSSFEAMNVFIEQHGISPVVDSTYPLADYERAFQRLTSGDHFGKVCLTLS